MCGIAGKIYAKQNNSGDLEVENMLGVIRHRGPDDEGTYHTQRIAIGQKRLSIVDLSRDGRQPMSYLSRYKIVYNGEIYNYIELKAELQTQGYVFATKTDTEVLLAAYDFWGEECLDHFNGMWAFILYDSDQERVFCARDRFGVKPLYYYKTDTGLALASEIKEFTVLDDWKPLGNIPRIIDFILYNGAHDYCDETLFQGVYQVKPGGKLIYDLKSNEWSIKTWYHLSDKRKPIDIDFETASRMFSCLFEDAIKIRLRSDVKVGSCLSGGLDSSSIVCMMNELLKKENKASKQEVVFAVNHVGKYDESAYVEAVVEHTGVVKHVVEPNFEEVIDKLNEIVWHQDEPFGSTSIIAQWDVYEKAREQGLIVMLDGQGADEYLAGYSSFQKVYFRELLLTLKWKKLKTALNKYKKSYNHYYYSPYRDLIDVVISRVVPEDKMNRIKGKIKHLIGKHERTDFIKDYQHYADNVYLESRSITTNLSDETISEMMHTSLPKLVHHQDRNAMAHSIESRAPFLDYRLVEFVFNLPSDYKVNLGITKYVMREGLKNVIPTIIRDRMDKLGFATPQDVWIKQNRQRFRNLLEEACEVLTGILSKEVVLAEFDRQVQGKPELDSIFWCVICVSTWIKIFKVQVEI